MLTFISGWRTIERDRALIQNRDGKRRSVFFVEDSSHFPNLLPEAPIIEVWRNGTIDFAVESVPETIVRLNYDTEHSVLARAILHVMLHDPTAQVIVTYDALNHLYRLFPHLRQADALLAANERLDAPPGDRVLFSRGGSFLWRDHLLESKTSLLFGEEVIDGGIVPDEIDEIEEYPV
ncbi:MAG TPA: hypothetical protein PLD47_10110 [Aggregatilineales bacterium]|nr:hypothetical protein [Anaerolineales bacterium]HRE48067.1 hypothetical protein [Aggregatilineales bacterium]